MSKSHLSHAALVATLISLLDFGAYVTASAQTVPNSAVTVIKARWLFESERGVMLGPRDVLVRDGTIEAVGENLAVPAGALLVDLRCCALLPGLIDAHTHLLMEHPGNQGPGELGVNMATREGEVLRALRGAARARTYLDAGFTTLRDLGNSGLFADVALKQAIHEGSVPGPRLYVSGPGLAPVAAQLDGLDFRHRYLAEEDYRIVRGAEDGREAVRENVTFGADLIKIYANASPNPAYLSTEEMRAIVEEAHLMKVRVTAHATTDLAIQRALAAGVDSIEHGRGASDSTLALMAKQNVYFVPTEWDEFLVRKQFERFPELGPPQAAKIEQLLAPGRDLVGRASAARVSLAAGSDFYIDLGMPRGAAAKHMLFAYEAAGIPAAQVLQMATIGAARLIGEPKIGVIAPGAFADLIAIEGNPTANLSSIDRVRFVMKDGKVYNRP